MIHTGFLTAICQAPDDDAPRLVYADWLEEQGDPHRAEFIRLGCRLAHLDPDDLVRRDLEPLWAMEQEHGARWAAELPTLRGIEWVIYRRGFVEIIRARSYKALVEAAQAARAATVLRGVVLFLVSGFKTFRDAECLAKLEYLNLLPKSGITPECVLSLAGCPHLAGLRHLVLNAHGMTVEGARALGGSPHLTSLHELYVSSVELAPQAVRALVQSRHFAQLRCLSLDYTNAGDAEVEALAGNATLANLESLHLRGRGVTSAGLAALADSPHAGRLRSLGIPFNEQCLAKGARRLAESPNLSALRRLDLEGCRIGDRGAVHLAGSATLRGLTGLKLGNNGIGDEGMKALAGSPILANVRLLNLSGNRFADAGALALAHSPYLSRLRSLNLGNPSLREGTRQALRKRFRDVEGNELAW